MKEAAIREELIPGSKKLYFIFGGVAAELAMPPFEFYSSAKIIEENKIFFRDFSQAWYQNGLPGVGDTFASIAGFIEKRVAELEPEEVFFVGNSMGGYAAILFASLLGRGTAIAFAPQTFVSPLKRLWHRERRWSKQITKMQLRTALKPHIWNLKPWLKTRQMDANIEIYVAEDSRLDYLHAAHLRGLESVQVHTFPVGGHNLVKQLRDEGALPAILSGSYGGKAAPRHIPRPGTRPLYRPQSVVGAPSERALSGADRAR